MMTENEKSTEDLLLTTPKLASLRRRGAAFLIDSFVLCIIAAIAGSIFPILGALLAWFFYAPLLESSEIRATIGKHLMGLQVADLLGKRISLKTALIRNIMKLVSISMMLIGFLVALFNRKKQTLHDLLADTIVVVGRNEKSLGDAWLNSIKDVFGRAKTSLDDFTSASSASESMISQLERLQSLHGKGALTDQEYEKAKNLILKN